MSAVVGPGILARMQEVGDTPLTSEWTEVVNMGAYTVKVAKAWGHLGLYVYSHETNEVAGPFGGG